MPNNSKDIEPNANDAVEYQLRVFADRSELVLPDGDETSFIEGPISAKTKLRYKKITDSLGGGYLREQVRLCRDKPESIKAGDLSEQHQKLFESLVSSMTSEVGRALVGLTVLQVAVKSIEPSQSIRLHKGSSSSRSFGWQGGISMRSLDSSYITPLLREEGLVKLNSFGFMMTRTLAENYPYTRVYKAAMRGARDEWLDIVEGLEDESIQPLAALHFLLSKLLNNAAKFEELANQTLDSLAKAIEKGKFKSTSAVSVLVRKHMDESTYAARIMEIAMHSLMQATQEVGALGSATVIPLSQMRSANKKHGNIGDIELQDGGKIIESWDAKYGKPYLRDELEELNDKLELHDAVVEVGFVVSEEPQRLDELKSRIAEIEELHGVSIGLLSLEGWVEAQLKRAESAIGTTEATIAERWITAYTESIAQKRPNQAPIDEPCYQWLASLLGLLSK